MKWFDLMQPYLAGEKAEALVFIAPIGLLSLLFGAWLLAEGGGFQRGVAIPFVLMGLVMTVVGTTVGLRTPSQVQQLVQGHQTAPEATRAAEQARMAQVNRAWPIYLAIWAAMAVAGLLLRFATRSDLLQGLGIALVFFGGVGMMVDGFAERRARPYTEALGEAAGKTP